MITPKAYIQTFGCQMNEHDSYRMVEVLARQGYAMTEEVDEASLVILNTCSVRQNPENKVYSLLGRLRRLKRRDAEVIIGVGGSFDVMAGIVARAPATVQSMGLEWAWRLVMEPRKLWKRYLSTNSEFIWLVVRELVRGRS